jgi:SWI/SNF-related matrix-associated actin-dependent regulator of chromatin subfamily A3
MADADKKLLSIHRSSMPGYHVFRLTKRADQISITFQDGTKLADVNAHLEKVLGPIIDREALQFEAIADVGSLRDLIGRSLKASDPVGRFNIHIYGLESACERVGGLLSTDKVYLQRPDHLRPGCVYNNPHYLKIPGTEFATQQLVPSQNIVHSTTTTTPDKEGEFRKAIANIYSGLKRGTGLHRVVGDRRVKTPLLQ